MHQTTSGGATMAPMEVPELNQPVATDFSLSGNHSETTLMAAGMAADSEKPSRARKKDSDNQPVVKACSIQATDQNTVKTAKPMRVPIISSRYPAIGCISI